jgi:tetratricopeptide (TPR) repeat protein
MRAVLHARLAEHRAAAGDADGALRALDVAERGLADVEDGHRWYYMSPENDQVLGAYRGSVMQILGRHREAIDAYEWTLSRMDPALLDWRSRIAADRDRALAAT